MAELDYVVLFQAKPMIAAERGGMTEKFVQKLPIYPYDGARAIHEKNLNSKIQFNLLVHGMTNLIIG
ncbi:hypothetical protein XENTR_v10013079 [Xenopus tropicalis]|nr:hypothetical protein XENTR_v10013079 [Xenopus tropicalis]